MAISEARKRANRKYNDKTYERIAFDVKKGERNRLKYYCTQHETSLNSFVTACVSYCIQNNIDLSSALPLADVLPEGDGFPPED